MAAVPLAIEADVRRADGHVDLVRGQSQVAVARDPIAQVRLVPEAPPALPEAVAAVDEADWVVLGPGSWFTSVIPHLLVPDLAAALHRTAARRIVVLNLTADAETPGMGPCEHLDALRQHAPGLRVDAVIADPGSVDDVDELADRTHAAGGRLLLRQVRRGDGTSRHDPLRLAAAISDVVEGFLGDVGPAPRDGANGTPGGRGMAG
jgi:uncharacterized cofD-like protein